VKLRVPAAAFLFFMAVSCGKVGNPKPPINRTPLAVNDVKAGQTGYTVTLSWVNPSRYVDENAVDDLAFVRILRNGVVIAREKAGPPGQPQSYAIDVSNAVDSDSTYAVQLETSRGRTSPVSAPVAFRPKDVPGPPVGLQATVDQERIVLTWMAPQRNSSLADFYFVQRSDRPPLQIKGTSYEDPDFEPDRKYDYTVTAVRAGDPPVAGPTGVSTAVVATDKVPPRSPTGLTVESAGAGAVFVKWDRNKERDVSTYLVYRSDLEKPLFPPTAVDGIADTNYRSGLTYQLVAVDKSGNASERSAPQAGP
jgi:hypothetical protein